MAKKLTAKSIRQGQTVYIVSNENFDRSKFVTSAFICESGIYFSEKKATAQRLIHSGRFITYSRRKATSKAKELNRMMGVM
tara:strand:- start:492 stop:734 length:243 start_codon:yes stop_codon:yes gene_type:complete